MKPLTETPDHKKAKDIFTDGLRLLGYRTHQEFDFLLVGLFGYQVKTVWRGLQDLKILRGSRYISKDKDIATYPHSIDIFAERVTTHGLKEKVAIEIDGEIHKDEDQQKRDRLFEAMWDLWVEAPQERFRVWKHHILKMPPELTLSFVQFVLRGKYTELCNQYTDHDIDMQVLISKVLNEARRHPARKEQIN